MVARSISASGNCERIASARLFFVLKRFDGISGSLWHGPRILLDFLFQIFHGGVQLSIASGEGSVRQVIHDNVRIDPVSFDQPFALRPVHTEFRGGGDSLVRQSIAGGKPDFAAPRASADNFSDVQSLECLR